MGVGWPRLALQMGWFVEEEGKPAIERGVWFTPKWLWKRLLPNAVVSEVPIRPIWSGLAVDVIFYGAVWFAITTALVHGRRYRRFTRGLCPLCRYDLRHDFSTGCPECGWRRAESAPA
ncbi:MAG: hypothetical protein DHS20C14_10380 [Phycisphaeraceae bacterium]|nr:MAG: hypothetical protein DHS20C14_10380 [Phycisphaeraceae bacterium]